MPTTSSCGTSCAKAWSAAHRRPTKTPFFLRGNIDTASCRNLRCRPVEAGGVSRPYNLPCSFSSSLGLRHHGRVDALKAIHAMSAKRQTMLPNIICTDVTPISSMPPIS